MRGASPALTAQGPVSDLAWRIYVLSIGLSFFVGFEPAPTDMVFMVGLFVFLLSRPVYTPFLSGTAVIGILLFCFFSVVSLMFVVYVPLLAVRAVVIEYYMIALFALTAYYVKIRGDRAFFIILLCFTIGGVLASFVTIAALLGLVPDPEAVFRGDGRYQLRVKATFKDPNVFGPFLVPCLLFTIWIIIEQARLRVLAFVVLGLLLLSLLSTYSRGAWAHFLASLSIFGTALLIYRPTARPVFTAFIWLVIALLLVVLLFLDQITTRLSDTYFAQRLQLQSYDESRFSYVADAASEIWYNPLGIGPYQARYKYGYLPHNTWIALAMHNGILTSVGLALIYGSSMARCTGKVLAQRPGWTKYALVLAVLLGLFVLTQVVGTGHWRHLYVMCGLAFGSYHSDRILPDGFRNTVFPARRRRLRPAASAPLHGVARR